MRDRLHPAVVKILKSRGIKRESDIAEFISQKPMTTHDPFLMADLQEAAEYIYKRINDGAKICIYGDYDADGVTSVGILWRLFSALIAHCEKNQKTKSTSVNERISYYIPSRFREGYGLNKTAIKKIADCGVDMIITVDCGSSNIDEVNYAKSLGIDIVVTDHHSVGEEYPDCLFLNPQRKDCAYPFKELAGCGVAFKLAQGLQRISGLEKKSLNGLLELVAIGTLADMMPVVDENRTLIKYGLRKITDSPSKVMMNILHNFELSLDSVNTEKITYLIAPMINSAGRMGDADEAVKLFVDDDSLNLESQICAVMKMNERRKQIQESLYERCLAVVDDSKDIIVLKPTDSHEGIAGIVAGKLKQKLLKPVIILSKTNNGYKGTARSTDSFDLYGFLSKHKNELLAFGGHRGACGLTVPLDYVEKFIADVEREMAEYCSCNPSISNEPVKYDALIVVKDIDEYLVNSINMLEPFGKKNERPKFGLRDVEIRDLREFGDGGRHLRFIVRSSGSFANLQCVLFNVDGEQKNFLKRSERVNISGVVDVNEFKGNKNIQFIVDRLF